MSEQGIRQPWHPDGSCVAILLGGDYAIFRTKDGLGAFYWTRLGSRGLDENVNLWESTGRFYGKNAEEKCRQSASRDAERYGKGGK